jgi:hypothetical protein
MGGYSYNLVKGAHFSMNLGLRLFVMDIGITMGNDVPWLLWPIPSIGFSWEYEWISFGIIPGARLTLAPKKPICLIAVAGSNEFDVSLWYRSFRNGNPSAEIMGVGVGVKNDTNKVMLADGRQYGVNYYALYGTARLLKLFEISGGWAFNGKEGYGKIEWDSLFESDGYSGGIKYDETIGNGFFIKLSAKMIF